MDRAQAIWNYITASPINAVEFGLAAVAIWVGVTWIVMWFDIRALKKAGRW